MHQGAGDGVGKPQIFKGFTLIELLVTIAVLSILATIAVPNFSRMLARAEASSAYNSVLSGLNYARSEAVRNREDVLVSISSDAGGWSLVVDSSARGVIYTSSGGGGNVSVSSGEVEYNALGRSSCDPKCSIAISHVRLATQLVVEVNRMGRAGRPINVE